MVRLRLLLQVGRQIQPGQHRLEIVGQQESLRTAAALIEMHDAALEALIDEVGVARIGGAGWLVGAPQICRLNNGNKLSGASGTSAAVTVELNVAPKLTGFPSNVFGRVRLYEVDDLRRVVRVSRRGRLRDDSRVWGPETCCR